MNKKPDAIIFDIDGTLAIKHPNRSPYDYAKIHLDMPHEPVVRLLHLLNIGREYLNQMGPLKTKIIIVTGRDGSCEQATKDWLKRNHIPYDELFIRPPKNRERDTIIKERIYKNHIAPRFNTILVLEDRTRCVEMWRKLGLVCLQVSEGNF